MEKMKLLKCGPGMDIIFTFDEISSDAAILLYKL